MLAPPKSLIGLAASFETLRMAQRLQRRGTAAAEQERARQDLLAALSATAFGREHGMSRGMTYDQFRQHVGLRTYESFVPYIERMKQGEPDVLWPGRCALFAVSAGTTAATPKHLPVTEATLAHFRAAGRQAILHYTARVGHAGVFRGRHLFLGGSTALEEIGSGVHLGDLSGIMMLNLPGWAEKHLHEPGAQIAQMSDWAAKLDATIRRTRTRDISLLAGIPTWLLTLADALRQPSPDAKQRFLTLQALWPNLECLIHTGLPLGPYAEELRQVAGPKVVFHEVYLASEGFIASQDGESMAGLRLMTGTGVFFEFLPLADYHEARLQGAGARAMPLEQVQPGVDYVVVLTTPAGLCRYVLGDIVRFVSVDPPRLTYQGRTQLHLSTFGENVVERELTDALLNTCHRHAWRIVNFHVAPLAAPTTLGRAKSGRHEWWVELRPGTVETPTGPTLAPELDAELQRSNESYRAKRAQGMLDAPVVRLVMPGLFESWMRENGRWGGQYKMPRCRNDRLVADALSRLSPFSAH